MVRNFTLLFCVLLQLQTEGWATANSRSATSNFKEFSSLRTMIVDKISTAKQRVWLASEFISDFDISLALYVAKFRGLDVRVMLAETRIDGFLSQYDYLSGHAVPLKTTADSDATTYLWCDDNLISVNSDLDFLSERKSFTMRMVKQKDTDRTAARTDKQNRASKVEETFRRVFNHALPSDQVAYDYSRKVHRRPSDVTHRLPSKTIADKNKPAKQTDGAKGSNL